MSSLPILQRQEISLKVRWGGGGGGGRETASGDQGTSPSKPCKQWYLSNTEMVFLNMADDFSVFIPPPPPPRSTLSCQIHTYRAYII